MKYNLILLASCSFSCVAIAESPSTVPNPDAVKQAKEIHRGDNMVITTAHKYFPNTTKATSSFEISAEDIKKNNLVTTEDVIRSAPGIQVRRRFIGDTNGVTATRGSTNFQTAHTMLFSDGVPLSNLVQTAWNGAPKWSLIAPNAIDSVKIFYGPFSAEHPGNAFGSVINVRTKMPEEFKMHFDVTGMIQESNRFGRDEVLTGHKEYLSVGNKFGDFSVFGFYNHLDNDGQPQSFDQQQVSSASSLGSSVTGGFMSQDIDGNTVMITGDGGVQNNVSDLYEIKLGYDLNDDLTALFTLGYENIKKQGGYDARNYLTAPDGSTFWGNGKDITANQDGFDFTPDKRRFGASSFARTLNERETLMYGLNLSGKISKDWDIDSTVSYFDAYKDRAITPNLSLEDPGFDNKGTIKDTKMWWATYDIKLATQNLFGNENLGFMSGYQFNNSFLNVTQHKSDNILGASKDSQKDDVGGSTELHSFFAQSDLNFLKDFNVLLGARLDFWQAKQGHVHKFGFGAVTQNFDDRNETRISPKFSLSYAPNNFSVKYSFTKAYRFPIAEELFKSSSDTSIKSIADPSLKPETGFFHDLTARYELDDGFASLSLFHNKIHDEIMRTTQIIGAQSVSTFLAIDETEAIGVELVYQQDYIFDTPVGVAFNATWLDKEIMRNDGNIALVGKEWVRTPKFRVNATATYHITDNWDSSLNINYRSRQFQNEDNSDTVTGVFGSSSDYTLVNLKSSYSFEFKKDVMATFSAGIDNLLNEDYYDHHPYPQRTYFLNVALDI